MSGLLPQHGEILLYDNGADKQFVSVVFKDETFWLTQSGMAELFDCSADNISLHLKNIYADGELEQAATTEKFSVVRKEGSREVRRSIDHYDLDAIIAVGYRVNSKKATHFRQWATKTLKEYIQKGFVLNDELMKNGRPFGKDYFDELLERIREIRASERRAYQKIADVFEQCSYDYDKNSETTKAFMESRKENSPAWWENLYTFCARACADATKGYGLAVDDFCKLPFLLLETAATVQQREKALDVFDETFRSNVIQMENFLRETNR